MKNKPSFLKPTEAKWGDLLHIWVKLAWTKVWNKGRTRKEEIFIWTLWHHVVVVNAWRAKINWLLDNHCPFCARRVEEIEIHRFWECPQSQQTWHWAINIINRICTRPSKKGPWKMFTIEKCFFTDNIKGHLKNSTLFGICFKESPCALFGLKRMIYFSINIIGLCIRWNLLCGIYLWSMQGLFGNMPLFMICRAFGNEVAFLFEFDKLWNFR